MSFPFRQKSYVYAVGTVVLLYVANFMFVQWGWSPFLYCIGRQVVAPIYEALAVVLTLGAIGYFAFIVLRQRYDKMGEGLLLVGLAFGLPQFADIIFRLGGSCG